MSRTFRRRIFITAISLLLALAISESVQRLFVPESGGWTSILLTGTLAVLAAALGLFIDTLLPPEKDKLPASSGRPTPSSHLEADILQLNRELEQRANQHEHDLARLNVELSLQMAKHQQAEAVARKNEERFRNLAENIQEGLTILENGRIVYIN